MKKLLVLAALTGASMAAFAQTTQDNKLLYGELGYTEMTAESDALPGYSSDNPALTGIIGYKFSDNLAGEVLLAGSLDEETVGYGSGITSEVDSSIGLFVRPSLMMTNDLELFGRVGYVTTEITATGPGGTASVDDSSFAYGAGLNYHFTDTFYGQFSYTSFYDKDGDDLKGYTLGVGMRF